MVRLIVLGREGSRQVYGTRRLVAGDEFEMPRQTADLLIRTGRAKLASPTQQPAEPAPVIPPPPVPTFEPTPVSHETNEEPDEPDAQPDSADIAPNEPPRRPRGRPPIHGRYSRRDL
jgi:hypothetical protein